MTRTGSPSASRLAARTCVASPFGCSDSVTEADDAVQEAWIRLSRTDTSDVGDLRAWLTTVVGRVCLNMLRSRRTRREASLETHLPDRS